VAGREVARLVGSIDAMRRQLEGRPFVETFAADLSHELKNPVAAIRASAEVLLDGALEEREKAEHFAKRILEAAQRIERLTAELLSLAEVEARGTAGLSVVDLGGVLREVEKQLPKHPEIDVSVLENPRVRGDRPWLLRVVYNLLDNARTHASGSGEIRVCLDTQDGEARLVVENAGEVVKHVQKELFSRFVTTRADKGGTGLGLSIVRAVAEAHAGRIVLRHAGPPLVVFELRLPLA
jgi:signal transduction histidine kinase